MTANEKRAKAFKAAWNEAARTHNLMTRNGKKAKYTKAQLFSRCLGYHMRRAFAKPLTDNRPTATIRAEHIAITTFNRRFAHHSCTD